MAKERSILAKARTWAARKRLFGAQAFLRYVILSFIENLNQVSRDFVFKGGNLLWVYIGTPRATIDLDLATLKATSHQMVRRAMEGACAVRSEIRFSLVSFKEVEQEEKSGCVAMIAYATEQGATNRFSVDIVYAIEMDSHEIESPINVERRIRSATLENIIADKLGACHRYRSGNTRMKDYDDLWRLSGSKASIDEQKLERLCSNRKIPIRLDVNWISRDLEHAWTSHQKRYPDLPKDLASLFSAVNLWLRFR